MAKNAKEVMLNLGQQVVCKEIANITSRYPVACARWAERGNPGNFIEFVLDICEIGAGDKLCPNLLLVLDVADDPTREHLFSIFRERVSKKEETEKKSEEPEEKSE